MIIRQLFVRNLRNHSESRFAFGDSINVLFGKNGAGKTTILEAISIASLSKSFLPAPDASMIKNGESEYLIRLEANRDISIAYDVNINFSSGKKKISTNSDDNLLPKDIIGEMPIVILSPDFKSITFGSPQDRRSFIDSILCQTSKTYLEYLLKLKKCLKQRNNMLGMLKKSNSFDKIEFEQWTYMLIELSTEIMLRRNKFISSFLPYFVEAYNIIANDADVVSAEYEPYGINREAIAEGKISLRRDIEELANKVVDSEMRRGTTLFGPQKDELKININGGLSREYASQGQHKTLLIGLKIAEFNYLKELKRETPIILLDDIFSELDENRSSKVLEIIKENNAQIFITMTNPASFENFSAKSSINFIEIKSLK